MTKHVLPTSREKRFVYVWGIVHVIWLLGSSKVLYFDGATLWEEIGAGLVLLFFMISAYKYAKIFRNGSAQAVMKETFPHCRRLCCRSRNLAPKRYVAGGVAECSLGLGIVRQ